jgi:hypothetical protein
MRRAFPLALAAGALLVLTACGSSYKQASESTATAAPAAAASTSPAPTTAAETASRPSAAAAAQSPAPTPATNPVERLTGVVASVMGTMVTLMDGGTFALTPQTTVTRRLPAAASALQSGEVVAVTATRQPDNTLSASLVNAFATAPNGFPLGQRPLDAGNLMTNATIDQVTDSGFTVTFPGGGARVTLAPDARITVLSPGSAADVTVGASVSASVRDGLAQTVSIQ